MVDDAERTDGHTLRRNKRYARVENDMGLARNRRIIHEARILGSIVNNQRVWRQDGVGAERYLARESLDSYALGRFDPVPIAVNQANHGDGSLAELGSDTGYPVRLHFRFSVQQVVLVQGIESLRFVGGNRSN